MYQCPKGHQSTDSDYCSECGALIGQSKILNAEPLKGVTSNKPPQAAKPSEDICPDCGTPREGDARFCEVCRHDFQENKTGVAEVIVASQQETKDIKQATKAEEVLRPGINVEGNAVKQSAAEVFKNEPVLSERLNVVITVDKDRVSSWEGESPIKPDARDRVFPLDIDENLVGRRSQSKGVYPEIEINDPGVSHRHLKFIKQINGSFAVLELGSANGSELNGTILEAGVNTVVKPGDELTIGIWTRLKIQTR